MLKKRIIPTLLLKNNRMVKGVNFKDYRDTGDPISASKIYNSQFVDELIFIDIDATTEKRDPDFKILKEVSKECFMPFTFGGGIKNIEQIKTLLRFGADKVIINSSATNNKEFIYYISMEYSYFTHPKTVCMSYFEHIYNIFNGYS